jgi:hypothetical protein
MDGEFKFLFEVNLKFRLFTYERESGIITNQADS